MNFMETLRFRVGTVFRRAAVCGPSVMKVYLAATAPLVSKRLRPSGQQECGSGRGDAVDRKPAGRAVSVDAAWLGMALGAGRRCGASGLARTRDMSPCVVSMETRRLVTARLSAVLIVLTLTGEGNEAGRAEFTSAARAVRWQSAAAGCMRWD